MTGKANSLELARIASALDLAQFRAFGMFFDGWARVESDLLGGLDGMRGGVDSLRAQNILIFDGLVKIALAKTEAEAGDPGRAVAILDEALATADRLGHRTFEAELHRARGEILLSREPANPAPAEDAFVTAIAVAKRQGARSFELRARAGAGQTLSIDCPPRRRTRRSRARPHRLCADVRVAGDQGGAGNDSCDRGRLTFVAPASIKPT